MSLEPLVAAAARYPLLTPAQEISLGRQIRAWQGHAGGPDAAPELIRRRGQRALNKFVSSNLRLAIYVARRFHGRGVPLEDLVQSSNEGLILAAKRFEPRRGYRFSSYGIWYALQACQVAVAQQAGVLKLPTTVSESIRRAERCREALRLELNREPSTAEVEEAAKLRPGQLADLKLAERMAQHRSLDRPCNTNGSGGSSLNLLDQVAGSDDPAASLATAEFRNLLHKLVDTHPDLAPQQRYVLRCRYLSEGPAPTLTKLANELHMNRETLRRHERAALDQLRSALPPATPDYRQLLCAS